MATIMPMAAILKISSTSIFIIPYSSTNAAITDMYMGRTASLLPLVPIFSLAETIRSLHNLRFLSAFSFSSFGPALPKSSRISATKALSPSSANSSEAALHAFCKLNPPSRYSDTLWGKLCLSDLSISGRDSIENSICINKELRKDSISLSISMRFCIE